MSTSALTAMVRRSVRIAQPLAEAYAKGNMLTTVRITRDTPDAFDRNAGRMTPGTPVLVYEGPARMYAVSGGTTYNLGDEPQEYGTSYVSVPIEASRPQVQDTIRVLDHTDASLVNRRYKVTGVDSGGLIPAVHLCAVIGAEPTPGNV